MEITIPCQWCGQPMRTRDLRRRYHKINKDGVCCAKEARLECKRLHERERRRNGHTKPRTGTGMIGPHHDPDHEQEARKIKDEMVWLKLRRKEKQYS